MSQPQKERESNPICLAPEASVSGWLIVDLQLPQVEKKQKS